MNDPRVEAARIEAERRWPQQKLARAESLTWLDEGMSSGFVLGAQWADRADREQGIHRVKVDDVTVERVYAEISHNLTPVIGRNRLRDRDGEQPEPLRPHIEAVARAVLAALTEAES